MKKSDLKTGMVIKDRDGKVGIVLLGTTNGDIIGGNQEKVEGVHGGTCWKPLSVFDEDLKYSGDFKSDVMEIYNAVSNVSFGTININKLSQIWKRSEFVELTMDEIASKFNIDVNLLKIKK